MAKVVTDNSHYKAIADAIRQYTYGKLDGVTMRPSEMPSKVNIVAIRAATEGYQTGMSDGYDDGYSEGLQEGYDDGFTVGEKSEYDRFWDSFQDNGNRKAYGYAFGGWTAEAFKPKYSMTPTNCTYMFAKMADTMSLTEALEQAGVTLDTSLSNNHTGMFFESTRITEIPHIDLSKSAYATNLFNYCGSLKKVEITVAANTVPNYSGWFTRCDVLEDLKVNGVIDKTGMTLQHCPKLSKASITSVVNALSPTTSGLSVTFSATAVDNAFTEDEWAALAATKTNWTINLV